MNVYRVTAGPVAYLMRAPNIQAASQFVRHWPGVMVRRVWLYVPMGDEGYYVGT